MVRPKLVQEGKPLVHDDEIQDWEAHQDGVLNSATQYQHQHQQHQQPRQQPRRHEQPQSCYSSNGAPTNHNAAGSNNNKPGSSLARALGSTSLGQQNYAAPTASYRTVIGGGDVGRLNDQNDGYKPTQYEEDDDDDMMMATETHGQQQQQYGAHHHHQAQQRHFNQQQYQQPQHPSHYQHQNNHMPLHHQQPQQTPQQGYHITIGSSNNNGNYQATAHQSQHMASQPNDHYPPQQQHQQHYPPTYQQQHRHQHHQPPTQQQQQSYRIEIGAAPPPERMEGVTQDPNSLGPLVVIDGANVAYAYADALGQNDNHHHHNKPQPNVMGIQVACQYFSATLDVRVLVVLPASYYRIKPRPGSGGTHSLMETDGWEILQQLKQQGKLVAAPPTDDDDSYVLTIALREHYRRKNHSSNNATNHNSTCDAYCLSNDLYRDAQERDPQLKQWLSPPSKGGQGARISFAFCDMGQVDDYGQRLLDIVPNPRHPLVAYVEQQQQQQHPQQQPEYNNGMGGF